MPVCAEYQENDPGQDNFRFKTTDLVYHNCVWKLTNFFQGHGFKWFQKAVKAGKASKNERK